MRRLALVLASSALTLGSIANFGCGSSHADALPDSGTTPALDASTAPGSSDAAVIVPPAEDAGPPPAQKTFFYAHTDTTLFKIDADDPNLALQRIGDFDCVGRDGGVVSSMTDIAVDKQGKLVLVAKDTIFLNAQIQGSGVVCGAGVRLTGDASSVAFYGATFAPAGVLGQSTETLIVANSDGELYAVDAQTGALTIVGTFGTVPQRDPNGQTYPSANVGKTWELSGDLVFLENHGSPVGFGTVRDCPNPPSSSNCSSSDSLLEIDMTKLAFGNRGNVQKRLIGRITADTTCATLPAASFGRMFGITAYKGEIFGFSRGSLITRINNTTAKACVVADQSSTLTSGFAGAGVTTAAQVEPPR